MLLYSIVRPWVCLASPYAKAIIGNGSWIVDRFSGAGAQRVTDFWDQQLLNDTIKDPLRATGEYCKCSLYVLRLVSFLFFLSTIHSLTPGFLFFGEFC